MTKIFRTHPLNLHEIRSRIASSLGFIDLASCARVSQDWNNSFTPPLYKSVVLSKHSLSMESVERNKHFIQELKIQSSNYDTLSSTSAIEIALSEALKTNSTLTALDLDGNSVGDNGAQALSEALKINSNLTALALNYSSIRDHGTQALSEACNTNSTVTILGVVLQ
ncbi:MAG: hypothetical protein JOS17DRAFT_787789 [Linnemannia elongata]|nr:MAG: hypothetical protein JOS17DRAFT_787789 [Linnemannia elongata]